MLREVEELGRGGRYSPSASAISGGSAAKPVIVANSLSWERTEWLKLGETWVEAKVPPMGYAVIDVASPPRPNRPHATPTTLENEVLRLTFDRSGAIVACHDKEHGREVLAPGAVGNVLAVYHDAGDAWDIPMDYRDRAPERFRLEDMTCHEDGPCAFQRMRYRYGQSTLEQEVALHAGSRRIDFVTTVDWRESGRMLRTSIPVSVTDRDATCGIQFGSIRRPTHGDRPADAAKFEVCAHKWVDLSDGAYGVAILDDCKYGHRVRDCILDLNLLRSTHTPDPRGRPRPPRIHLCALSARAATMSPGALCGQPMRSTSRCGRSAAARNALLPPLASWFAIERARHRDRDREAGRRTGTASIVRTVRVRAGVATEADAHVRGFSDIAAAATLTNLMEEGGIPLALADGAA